MTPALDPALFRETLGHYPTGVAVVTAVADDGTPAGMVVGSFSSVSLDPPLVAFFPATASFSFARLRTASAFCVNVLAADQEQLCRRFATGGADKFDGVAWRPGPLGSPVLDGAVSWIECTFADVREAGDHFVVLGLVQTLAVERSTLPLLFFQGGYGRFAPRSFVAAPDPALIAASRRAETIRPAVEALSDELEVNCSVVARVGWDAVQVLAANRSAVDEPFPLGHRQPLIPPFGAVFLAGAPECEVEAWLQRAPAGSGLGHAHLAKVRARGHSILLAEPETHRRHQEALEAFEASDRLPRHEHVVRAATSELADLFCPDLHPGRCYDLANVVVPVPSADGQPSMALRMTGLPAGASTQRIQHWVDRLTHVAATTPRGDLTDMGMRITRLADAEAFSPPGHTGVGPLRLQGGTDTPTERLTVVLSHYLPGGRADLSPQPVETVYVLVSGELTMVSDGEEAVLRAYDSVHFTPGTVREVVNRSPLPASMLVIRPVTP